MEFHVGMPPLYSTGAAALYSRAVPVGLGITENHRTYRPRKDGSRVQDAPDGSLSSEGDASADDCAVSQNLKQGRREECVI